MRLTTQNKTLINTLERIDLQLKRIDECESLGMWECGAYFLSDSQETAEMAAGTYRALMKGEKSGVETSAINFWGASIQSRFLCFGSTLRTLFIPSLLINHIRRGCQ